MSGGLELRTYDPTGATLTGYLTTGFDRRFVDEFNTPGYGQVTVLRDSPDADLLVHDAVVKVIYASGIRYAWFVESVDDTQVNADGQQLIVASGRGLMAWLEDALVYPQGGLQDYNSPDRPFNFASADGPWKSTVTWSTPVGITWKDDTTARKGQPRKWANVDPGAQWIWKTDPTAAVASGTVNYFRSTFTLTEPTDVKIWATADNELLELYLNGTVVMTGSDFNANAPSWTQFATYATRLGKGEHVIAARVRNGKPWRRDDLSVSASTDKVSASNHGLLAGTRVKVLDRSKANGLTVGTTYFLRDVEDNAFKLSATEGGSAINITDDSKIDLQVQRDQTAGFLAVVRAMANGKPGTIIRRTNQAAWEVTDERPKHRPALIVKDLLAEAKDRGVYRLEVMSASSFSNSDQTGGGAWTTEVDLSLRVGTNLLQVLQEMVDLGVDFYVRPTDAALQAWESRGTDRSATVRLFPGHHLLEYSTLAEPKIKTHALVRSKDGWAQKANGVTTHGRRELYVEVGRTRSESTARIVADRILRRTGKRRITATTVRATPQPGATPYVDFAVGDVIAVPSPSGSGMKRARVLSIAMEDNSGTATYTPELEILDA